MTDVIPIEGKRQRTATHALAGDTEWCYKNRDEWTQADVIEALDTYDRVLRSSLEMVENIRKQRPEILAMIDNPKRKFTVIQGGAS